MTATDTLTLMACQISVPPMTTAAERDAHLVDFLAKLRAQLEQAETPVDLVVLPELSSIEYARETFEKLGDIAEPLDGASFQAWRALALEERWPWNTVFMSLPSHASVVVIGGGITGCSTLYHLAQMGVGDAILLERNALTSGTAWHSAAQVRALRHSQNLTRMIQYSVDLYARLEEETGHSVGWIQKGSLSIATNPDRLTHIQRQEALGHAYGIEARSISAGEAKERWPLMNGDDVQGAVWSPDDGRVSPSDVCAALVKAARGLGAKIFERKGVTGILIENGRIKGVETNQGTIMCDAIALCTGLWSREVGAMAGAEVPALACEHFYLLTRPVDGIAGNMPTLSDHDSHLYIRDDSGGFWWDALSRWASRSNRAIWMKGLSSACCPKTGITLSR